MKLHMWVCCGQLKTPHTNIGHHDLLFLPETQTLMQKCRSHSGRNSRSRWPIFVCGVFNCPRQTHMWGFINLEQVVRQTTWSRLMKLHMRVCCRQLKTSHTNIGHCDLLFLPEWLRHFCDSRSRWPIFVCGVFNCPRQTHMWGFINLEQVVCLHQI
jgi:hypothetical protein